MTNNMTSATSLMADVSVASFNLGVRSLQTSMILTEATATNFMNAMVAKINENKLSYPMSLEVLGELLASNMPRLIHYYMQLIQSGQRLQKPGDQIPVSETMLYLPFGYTSLSATKSVLDCTITFDSSFTNFYNEVMCFITQRKLEFLLLGLQDIYQQMGVTDLPASYALLQTTTEAAVLKLSSFAWSTKARRMSDVLHGNPVVQVVNPQFSDIPAAVQLALAYPPKESGKMAAANQALANIMAMDFDSRQKFLQNLRADQIAFIPDLAKTIRNAALIMKQSPWVDKSTNSMRLALLYGPSLTMIDHELNWARDVLRKSFSSDLSNLFIPDAFIDRVLNQLPTMRCHVSNGCFEVMQQPANLLQLHYGLQALEQNQTLPSINFVMKLPEPPLLTQLASCAGNNLPELVVSAVLIGGAAYCGYAIFRRFSFFARSFGLVRSKQETSPSSIAVETVATHHLIGNPHARPRRFFGGSSARDQQIGYTALPADIPAQFRV